MADRGERLAGTVAMVTGAARGIGAATARRLYDDGARVVLVDLPGRAVNKLHADWKGEDAFVIGGDVAAPADVEAAIDACVGEFGGLGILVNNAATGASATVEQLEHADWMKVVSVSLGGVLNGIKYAAPVMRAGGRGSIVNLSSVAARHAMHGMSAYAAAKAGVEAVTRCAAIELRPDGIRVNAVAPGMIHSHAAEKSIPFLDEAMLGSFDDFLSRRQSRWGEPEEVASVVAHLAGDGASFVTGQTHVVDFGASLLL